MATHAYNIATDCTDKHLQYLQTKDQVALTVVRATDTGLKDQSLTFSNLAGLSNRFANALKDLGIVSGDRVLIRLPNSAEFPIVFLGAVKAGAIPVPSSSLLKAPELQFLLDDSEAKVLVTTAELLLEEIEGASGDLKIIVVGAQRAAPLRFNDLIKNSSSQFDVAPTSEDDPAYWLYTSGTEGTPKAVIHAQRSIPAHDERVKLWQDLKYDDVVFNTSALNWSYALTAGMLDCWRHRVRVVTYDGPPDPEKLLEIIQKQQVSVFMSVPGIYRRIVREVGATGRSPLQNIRVALSAGELLSQETRTQFRELTDLNIYEGLGMTEHSVYLVQPCGSKIAACSCGQPLPKQRVAVLREDLTEAEPDEIGILATHRSCPGLMLGYRDDPEPFQGDWFLSGDLAKKDEAGNFYFIGRRDDVLTVGGYRVSPLEVEAVLNECPEVQEAGVVAQERDGKLIMVAYVVPTGEHAEEAILGHAREKLADYKVPRAIAFVEELPKTSNGKLKRQALWSPRHAQKGYPQ